MNVTETICDNDVLNIEFKSGNTFVTSMHVKFNTVK